MQHVSRPDTRRETCGEPSRDLFPAARPAIVDITFGPLRRLGTGRRTPSRANIRRVPTRILQIWLLLFDADSPAQKRSVRHPGLQQYNVAVEAPKLTVVF